MRPVRLLALFASMWLIFQAGSPADAQQKKGKLDKKALDKLAELARSDVDTLLKRFDTNGDGYLSRDELPPIMLRGLEKSDKNGDDKLDRQELGAFLTQIRRVLEKEGLEKPKPGTSEKPTTPPAKGTPKKTDRAEKKGPPPGFGPGGRLGPDFDALDKDADGRLTPDELKGSSFADRFDEIDTNKDGKIDKKEFEAYLKKQADKKSP